MAAWLGSFASLKSWVASILPQALLSLPLHFRLPVRPAPDVLVRISIMVISAMRLIVGGVMFVGLMPNYRQLPLRRSSPGQANPCSPYDFPSCKSDSLPISHP